jgi:hypothetical protein
LYGGTSVRTSLGAETLNAAETVRAYKGLAKVEQAFRSYKTIDTKNTIQANCSEVSLSFGKITQPTSLQQRALDLLSVSLICTQ